MGEAFWMRIDLSQRFYFFFLLFFFFEARIHYYRHLLCTVHVNAFWVFKSSFKSVVLWPWFFLVSGELNFAPEGLAQDAAWWLYLMFVGFQEVPVHPTRDRFEQFEQLDWFRRGRGGKWRAVPGVFLFKKTGKWRGNKWHPLDGLSAQCKCLVAPAVQFRLDSSHCSMTSFVLSVSSLWWVTMAIL